MGISTTTAADRLASSVIPKQLRKAGDEAMRLLGRRVLT
jgi:hypothetical protein